MKTNFHNKNFELDSFWRGGGHELEKGLLTSRALSVNQSPRGIKGHKSVLNSFPGFSPAKRWANSLSTIYKVVFKLSWALVLGSHRPYPWTPYYVCSDYFKMGYEKNKQTQDSPKIVPLTCHVFRTTIYVMNLLMLRGLGGSLNFLKRKLWCWVSGEWHETRTCGFSKRVVKSKKIACRHFER